jgi:hypothetical protein
MHILIQLCSEDQYIYFFISVVKPKTSVDNPISCWVINCVLCVFCMVVPCTLTDSKDPPLWKWELLLFMPRILLYMSATVEDTVCYERNGLTLRTYDYILQVKWTRKQLGNNKYNYMIYVLDIGQELNHISELPHQPWYQVRENKLF